MGGGRSHSCGLRLPWLAAAAIFVNFIAKISGITAQAAVFIYEFYRSEVLNYCPTPDPGSGIRLLGDRRV